MSITSITDGNSISNRYQLYGTQSAARSTDDGQSAAIEQSISDVSSNLGLSKRGQLFSKLQQLQQSDPDKFKQVCADIASKLKDAAQSQGSDSNSRLADLASRFDQAAQTGDLSQVMPQHRQHHHSATQAASDQYSRNQDAAVNRAAHILPGKSGQSDTLTEIIAGTLEEAGVSI